MESSGASVFSTPRARRNKTFVVKSLGMHVPCRKECHQNLGSQQVVIRPAIRFQPAFDQPHQSTTTNDITHLERQTICKITPEARDSHVRKAIQPKGAERACPT